MKTSRQLNAIDLLNRPQIEGLIMLLVQVTNENEVAGNVGISDSAKYKRSIKPIIMSYLRRFNMDNNGMCNIVLSILTELELTEIATINRYNYNKLTLIKSYHP